MLSNKWRKNTADKNDNCDYHLKNIELMIYDKNTTRNYIRLLTDSILMQQLGFCIGSEMPDLKIHENSNNIPSSADYTNAFGEILETPNYDVSKSNIDVDLSIDPVISCIWNAERVKNALANIGDGCILPYINEENVFKYDRLNHLVTHIYPLGINVVTNGNHSIFSGLIKKKGIVKITSIIDVSESIFTNQGLEEIKEIKIIKEIAELMQKSGLEYIYPEIEQFIKDAKETHQNDFRSK